MAWRWTILLEGPLKQYALWDRERENWIKIVGRRTAA